MSKEIINSSKVLYSEGKNDEWKTPKYAVEAIAKYISPTIHTPYGTRKTIIWCPFDEYNDSEYITVFLEKDFEVKYTHIKNGEDFLEYEPNFDWDIIISNPPFTNKRAIFERAMYWNKPFALLMSNTWLNDAAPKQIFKDSTGKDVLQLLMFDKRINFINKSTGEFCKKGITFSSSYYCRDILPRDIICDSLIIDK